MTKSEFSDCYKCRRNETYIFLACFALLFLSPFRDSDEERGKKVQTLHCYLHVWKGHGNVINKRGCNQKRNWEFLVCIASFWALVFFGDSLVTSSLLSNRQHPPAAA